jgi:putative acetyltransferase
MNNDAITIRAERGSDIATIHAVEASAFGREDEAVLVDALRELNQDFISLVASLENEIAGHICFSPVTIEGSASDGVVLALAPLAVLPEHRRRGIGSMLVQYGLQECRRRNVDAVFVVGDPRYYSRFGFRTAAEINVRCEFDVPDNAFKVFEFREGRLSRGVLRYSQPFHQV